MKRILTSYTWKIVALAALTAAAIVGRAVAQTSPAYTYKVLHTFNTHDGPVVGSLSIDSMGNLFGSSTAEMGRARGGFIFKLANLTRGNWPRRGLTWFPIWDTQGGLFPEAPPVADAAGLLFGTTTRGGASDCGVVYMIWGRARTKLYSFACGNDASSPTLPLAIDSADNLFGVGDGGAYGGGVAFEVSPQQDGTWTEKVLHSFGNGDGNRPSSLILDHAGNLYGTTTYGGPHGCGTVFELIPSPDGTWTENVIYDFLCGADGGNPAGPLAIDASGNLYGTTAFGGNAGLGTVFKVHHKLNGSWTERVLYSFTGGSGDGSRPHSNLMFDGAGNLYGTSSVVFRLRPRGHNIWTESLVFNISLPQGMVVDKSGNVFGAGGFTAFELVR